MFEIRKCINPECRLRYSILSGAEQGIRCPVCRSETVVIQAGLNQLDVPGTAASSSDVLLEALLDNIRSAWNVGAMFRAADGAGVSALHLCGVSATPRHPGVAKTGLGAEKSVPWHYYPDAVEAARSFAQAGKHIWALEGGNRAEPLADAVNDLNGPIILAVGNEVSGVDPGILEISERVVCLPMLGTKKSLNVATAFGIAVYWLRFLGKEQANPSRDNNGDGRL